MKKINKIFALLFALLMFINPIINVFAEANGNNQRQIGNTGGESVGDGVKISKTISPSELENYFDITLKVQTTEIAKEQDLAVVIVMDISRTMIQNKLEGENTTRLRAALNAGQKFVETFASNSNNVDAKRQLGYVAFNRDGHVLADIQECKSMDTANKINKDVYDKTISITKTIDSDNDVYGNDKTRFTNIEGGLQVAYDMLYNNTNTKDIKNKYIIFLSDGFPTTYLWQGYTGHDTIRTDKGILYDELKDMPMIYGTNYSERGARKAQEKAKVLKKKELLFIQLVQE